jgi:thymidylate synthase (FAD)
MAIEDARFVLPNACDTKMLVTMNARSLLNFFSHRCCNRAQWEIRALADQMLCLVKEVAPSLFAAAGPGCVRGPCPEGSMTCGRMEEVRARYRGDGPC